MTPDETARATDEELAREIATTISYTGNSQIRYQIALDLVRRVREAAEARGAEKMRERCANVADDRVKLHEFDQEQQAQSGAIFGEQLAVSLAAECRTIAERIRHAD